jgi:hypothetical protein
MIFARITTISLQRVFGYKFTQFSDILADLGDLFWCYLTKEMISSKSLLNQTYHTGTLARACGLSSRLSESLVILSFGN